MVEKRKPSGPETLEALLAEGYFEVERTITVYRITDSGIRNLTPSLPLDANAVKARIVEMQRELQKMLESFN